MRNGDRNMKIDEEKRKQHSKTEYVSTNLNEKPHKYICFREIPAKSEMKTNENVSL